MHSILLKMMVNKHRPFSCTFIYLMVSRLFLKRNCGDVYGHMRNISQPGRCHKGYTKQHLLHLMSYPPRDVPYVFRVHSSDKKKQMPWLYSDDFRPQYDFK